MANFVDILAAQEYFCAICLGVMNRPVQIGCSAGHILCQDCVTQLVHSSPIHHLKCPICTAPFHPNSLVHIPYIERKINDLKVKCPHNKQTNNYHENQAPSRSRIILETQQTVSGNKRKEPDIDDDIEILNTEPNAKRIKLNDYDYCSWIGRYGDLSNHIDQCPFEMLLCPYSANGCFEKIKRKDIANHMELCPYCIVICPQCKRNEIARGNLRSHLNNECVMRWVNCDECGQKMRKKYQLKHIRYDCEETMILCEYSKFGCNQEMRRKNMEKHNQEDMKLHLKLVKESHCNLIESHHVLQIQIMELREKIDTMDRNQRNEPVDDYYLYVENLNKGKRPN